MNDLTFWGLAVAIVGVLSMMAGIMSCIRAVMTARTSQGAIAWASVLLTWPLVAVPMYWALGRNRFNGNVRYRRGQDQKLDGLVKQLSEKLAPFVVNVAPEHANARVLSQLSRHPILRGNDTELFVDGPATFAAIFAAIDRAEHFVLAEFYIVHDDQLGREFLKHLVAAGKRGCQVFLLYDDLGSRKMTSSFRNELIAVGGKISGMNTTKGRGNRFQLNFRNHRKIVVVDGKEAFIGGTNVGDEYVHRDKRLTPWRDTHMRIEGPAAIAAQFTFVEDWHWATSKVPELSWEPTPSPTGHDRPVFVLASGPDDQHETCSLFFAHCINSARHRLWIASPYFVPDEATLGALQLAAMRGVDVRIIIPGMPDKWLVKQAAMAYVPEVTRDGVRMFEYGEGFIHQKVMLIDDTTSVIGTANFDNRSFRLNFEVSSVTYDSAFAKEVEAMLKHDLERSHEIDPAEVDSRSLWFHVTSRVARLFAPLM